MAGVMIDAEQKWIECDICGGSGLNGHACGDDTCGCAWPEENVACSNCGGDGGWPG